MRSNDYEIKLNPDFIHRKEIEEAIKANDGYCYCALEKNDDTKCICKDFLENVTVGQTCHCGLYIKDEIIKLKKENKEMESVLNIYNEIFNFEQNNLRVSAFLNNMQKYLGIQHYKICNLLLKDSKREKKKQRKSKWEQAV